MTLYFIYDMRTMKVYDIVDNFVDAQEYCEIAKTEGIDAYFVELLIIDKFDLKSFLNRVKQFAKKWPLK